MATSIDEVTNLMPRWIGYINGHVVRLVQISTSDAIVGCVYTFHTTSSEGKRILHAFESAGIEGAIKQLRTQCLLLGEHFDDEPF